MERSDWPALDASHKETSVEALLTLFSPEILRCLIGRNSDERHALVGRTEPDDLGTRLDLWSKRASAFALDSLGLLLLLGSSRRGSEKARVPEKS